MGNGIGKFGICFTGVPRHPHTHDSGLYLPDPYDEGLGHSFCYIRPDPTRLPPSSEDSGPSIFRSISGASVSANTSTPPLSTFFVDPTTTSSMSGPLFETSSYFSSAPLHPIPRSGPILDRGFMSGPIDRPGPMFSGPLDRSLSHHHVGPTNKKWSLIRGLRRAISKTFKQNSVVAPVINGSDPNFEEVGLSLDDMDLQWAQGKAGEDRVHVVVSEEDGWVFVGIYDGFNGPDATDFLSSNLYSFLQNELKGLSWDTERLQLGVSSVNHSDVLKAMSKGLHKSEEAYFAMSDKMIDENAELALMGSCVLVILIKGEDVYVMNVGDSRALLARNKDNDVRVGMIDQDLDRIQVKPSLLTFQLTMDHSTCVEEEVQRIRDEHPDDVFAILNDRVKGSLKVTRAFGAGFLKQPKWNNALLEMFRIDYVGTSPYLNCLPSLCHHRLGPKDQFLMLSSDGLYQYFTNEEAVAEVELFISLSPEGDPAQHLVEEVLLRAAKKAGMDFYELLEIPQGDRRRYHDDVSIIIISFEGRIWRSCV